jgi:ATP-dependent Clp protease ATP-binding subunit ClpX
MPEDLNISGVPEPMASRSEQRCNFCNRPRNEVKKLVAGAAEGVHICDRCVVNISGVLSKLRVEVKSKTTVPDKALKKPREIVEIISQSVVSQDDAKREVAIAVYEHYRRRQALQSGGSILLDGERVEIEKSNILMLGPSGTGKTAIARAVAKMLDVPFYCGDATRLTQAGYVGDDVETLLQGLLADAGNDVERAQWGIIFIDEIDKLARKSGRTASGYRDVSGEGVQQSLLKLIEGSTVPVPRGRGNQSPSGKDLIDTTNVLFIGAGSFAGVEDIISQRLNRGTRVGFGGELRAEYSKTTLYAAATVEDIQEFGLIPELVGRLPVLTSTYELSEQEMITILTTPTSSFCKQFQALYALDGIDLQFDPAALRAIAQMAKKRSTGARALRSVLKTVLKPYSYEAPNDSDIVAIRITEEAVSKPGTAIVVRRSAAEA